MGNQDNEEIVIDVSRIFQALKKNIVVLLISAILFGAVGYGVSAFAMTPKYQASVNMIVNTTQESSTTVTNDNITSATKLVSTYAIIVKSNLVLDAVIDDLGLDMDYKTLADKVSVSAVDSTQIMQVTVTDTDAARAANILEAITEIAPDAIVDAVEAGSCKVVSSVMTSDEPVSPNAAKNTILAAIVGMILAIGAVLIRELTKTRTILDDKDVEEYLGLTVLSVIPEIDEGKK